MTDRQGIFLRALIVGSNFVVYELGGWRVLIADGNMKTKPKTKTKPSTSAHARAHAPVKVDILEEQEEVAEVVDSTQQESTSVQPKPSVRWTLTVIAIGPRPSFAELVGELLRESGHDVQVATLANENGSHVVDLLKPQRVT